MWSYRVAMYFLFACYTMPAVGGHFIFSDAELKALPAYCEPRMMRTPVQYDHWREVLGPDYEHTHHYCEGLGFLNRSYRARSQRESNEMLGQALDGINYLMAHANPNYSLMPEAYLNRGLVRSLMKSDGEAIKDLKKAIELNPKMGRAYVLASELLTKMKMKDEALKLATEGLRKNPGHKGLQRTYDKLGGKQPYPTSEDDSVAQAGQPPKDDVASPQQMNEKAGEASTSQKVASPPSNKEALVKETDQQATGGSKQTPPIGSPTNPWCRFCPDPAK